MLHGLSIKPYHLYQREKNMNKIYLYNIENTDQKHYCQIKVLLTVQIEEQLSKLVFNCCCLMRVGKDLLCPRL